MSVALLEWPPGQFDRCLELWDNEIFPRLCLAPGYRQARLLLRCRSVGGNDDGPAATPAQLALVLECDTPEQQLESIAACIPQEWIVSVLPDGRPVHSYDAKDREEDEEEQLDQRAEEESHQKQQPDPENRDHHHQQLQNNPQERAQVQKTKELSFPAHEGAGADVDGDFDLELCLELLERNSAPEAQQFLAELEEIWRAVDPELVGEVSALEFDAPVVEEVLRAVGAVFDVVRLRQVVRQIKVAVAGRIGFWELAEAMRTQLHPEIASSLLPPTFSVQSEENQVWARPRRRRDLPVERRVRLRFFARNLPVALAAEDSNSDAGSAAMDAFSEAAADLLPNPVLAVFTRDGASPQQQWRKAGCTEVVRSTSHPVWSRPVELTFHPGQDFDLKFAVYDLVDYRPPPESGSLSSDGGRVNHVAVGADGLPLVHPEFEDLVGETPMASLYAVLQEARLELPLFFEQQLQGLGVEESVVCVTHEAGIDYSLPEDQWRRHPLLRHEVPTQRHRVLGEESARLARSRFISAAQNLNRR